MKGISGVRRKMDWIAERLGIQMQQDWYKIRAKDVISVGGQHAMIKANNSVYTALKSIYPEFTWDPLLFRRVPMLSWNSHLNQRRVLDKIAEKLHY
jgi:hypothetical protein